MKFLDTLIGGLLLPAVSAQSLCKDWPQTKMSTTTSSLNSKKDMLLALPKSLEQLTKVIPLWVAKKIDF